MNIKTNVKFKRVEAGIYQWQGQIKVNEEAGMFTRDVTVTIQKNVNSYSGAWNAWGMVEELTTFDGTIEEYESNEWHSFKDVKEFGVRRYTEWAITGR